MENFIHLLLSTIISSTVVAAVINILYKRRTEKIVNEMKMQYDQITLTIKSRYSWKEKALAELLGPVNILLNRTVRAFNRYNANNIYLEAKVLKEGNETIRNLLLEKSYLIPNELLMEADNLIEHYDRWLEEYDKVRNTTNPDLKTPFVFVGTKGFPFPKISADKFQLVYNKIWNEVYG